MQSARLLVKNFGPLQEINIEVKDFLCLIGKQATGKSTIAKLIAIFEDENFRNNDEIVFREELDKFGMLNFLKNDSFIKYDKGIRIGKEFVETNFSFFYENGKQNKINYRQKVINKIIEDSANKKIKDFNQLKKIFKGIYIVDVFNSLYEDLPIRKLEEALENVFDVIVNNRENVKDSIDMLDSMFKDKGIYVDYDSQYIPSERNFLHIIANNIWGLINNEIQIPKHLLEIGQEYEKALNVVKEVSLDLIDKKFKYKREGKTSYIYHNKGEKVDLLQSASGLQSIIPIILLVEYAKTLKNNYHFNYVIEEPELNIYPETQHQLMKYLIKNVFDFNQTNRLQQKKLIITTHSPYILASINNLLLAFKKGKVNPTKVNKIIKKESWINPKNFNAYELKNGKSYPIINQQLGQIKSNIIDKVSDEFSDEFDKLLAL